jgi:MFS family permease
VAGILFFMAGSIVGGTADSMTQVILARAIQGLGAGALIPLAMAVIGDLVPPSDRGRWQGLTGAVFGVASVLGPFSGGWIADHADWRWVFFVSLPVGFVALAVVMVTLRSPPHPDRTTQIDYSGAALLAAGLSFVLGLPVMAIALALVLLIPETPLRRTVRETEPPPAPA